MNPYIIPVPFNTLQAIEHLADIHIRLFRRHDEFEAAFERLYADLKEKEAEGLKDYVIVLAGDIVHAKTDLSPEMVEVTSRFLTKIADIAPTILIAGNHDCNLANPNRMDSLSPIVNSIAHPNLHYIKHSAVVRVADVEFVVCSIFDEQEKWPTPADCTTDTKIALYHGPVHGAFTNSTFTITNRHVNVSTFDGYDMVLLGDIHSYQTLQEYNKAENKPIIVYAGSLIQQNHGEAFEGHGWCLWDVPKRSYEFVPLHNDYGYLTLEVKDRKIDFPKVAPHNVRMRLFTGDLDNTDVKKLITTLRKKYNIIELSVNKSRYTKDMVTKGVVHSYETLDLTQLSTQNSLITDWLERKHPDLDADILGMIENINKDLNGKIQHDDQSRNVHWRPLNFKFSNMFSYGEDNEINFEDKKGLYGIFAENAAGKSSAIEALVFCLYDKTPRAFKGDHIINNRKDSFSCELIFEINNETFGIKRVGARKKNGDVKVDVQFWKEETDGTVTSLNGEDRRDTNANIRSYVGTYEDFIMTALSSQIGNALFIDKSHSERKDLLIQFMGLNIFDKLFDAANEEAKEMNGVLKRFKKAEVTDGIASTHTELTTSKEQLAELEEQYGALKEQREQLDSETLRVQGLKKALPTEVGNLKQLEKQLTFAQKSYDDAVRDMEVAQQKLLDYSSQLNFVETQLYGYDMAALSQTAEQYDQLQQELQKHRNAVKLIAAKIEEKQKFKNKLGEYKYNPECNVCVENNKSVIGDLKIVADELDTLQTEQDTHLNTIAELNFSMVGMSSDMEKFEEANQLTDELDAIKTAMSKAQNTLDASKIMQEKSQLAHEKVKQDIQVYKDNEDAIIHNQKIDEELSGLMVQLSGNKKDTAKIEQSLRELTGKISVLETKKQELKDKLKEAEELETTFTAYTSYMEAIGRDGVPYDLMSKAIPQIEAEINNILSQIVDFTISLEVDGKNINGKLTYDYDRVWPLENSSGMERFVSSLAIRVALMNASNLPKPGFLIIDEGFSTLDVEHIHTMQTLFNILKTHFDFIFIISHLDAMRDMVDNLIEIKKDEGFSKISV